MHEADRSGKVEMAAPQESREDGMCTRGSKMMCKQATGGADVACSSAWDLMEGRRCMVVGSRRGCAAEVVWRALGKGGGARIDKHVFAGELFCCQ
eukprot:765800-Hanusia_phi.AAC.4